MESYEVEVGGNVYPGLRHFYDEARGHCSHGASQGD